MLFFFKALTQAKKSVLQLVYSHISRKSPPPPKPARPLPQLRGTNALSGFPGLHLFLPSRSSRHPSCPSYSYKPGPSPAQGLPFMVLFLLEKSPRHAYGFLPCPIQLSAKRPALATHLQMHMSFFLALSLFADPYISVCLWHGSFLGRKLVPFTLASSEPGT